MQSGENDNVYEMSSSTSEMSQANQIVIWIFVILGTLGLVLLFIQNFPVVGTFTLIGIVILAIYSRFSYQQDTVADRRESIIEDAEEFDMQVQNLVDDGINRSWAKKAREIDKPGLFPHSRDRTKDQVDELESEIDLRQRALESLSTLLDRIESFENSTNQSLPEFSKAELIDYLTHFDSELFARGLVATDLRSLRLDTKALTEIDSRSALLDDVEIKGLHDEIQNLEYETIEKETLENYYEPLVLAVAQLVTIRDEKPIIDTTTVVEELNQAIQNLNPGEQVKNPVEPLFDILESSMKIEAMLADKNLEYTEIDEEESLQQVINALQSNDFERISKLEKQINEIVAASWKKTDLYSNSWQDFEKLVADLWSDKGYSTTVTPSSADQGFDVRAEGNVAQGDMIIEAKQYSRGNVVGRPVVQKTLGTLSTDRARKAAVVTTSSFSSPARSEAVKANNRIELINGDELLRELNKSSLAPPARNTNSSRTTKYEPNLNPTERIHELVTSKKLLLGASEERISTQQTVETKEQDSVTTTKKETKDSAGPRWKYTAKEADHPFEHIVNPEQPVKQMLSIDICPNCGVEESIWRTENVNTGKRYKCSYCDKVWRQRSELQSEIDAHQLQPTNQPDGQGDVVESRDLSGSPSPETLSKLGDKLIAMANDEGDPHDIEKMLDEMDLNPSDLGLTESDLAEIAGQTETSDSPSNRDVAEVDSTSDSWREDSTSDESVTDSGEKEPTSSEGEISEGVKKDGQYISIEIVGFDLISTPNPMYGDMEQLEGIIVAMYIENRSENDWNIMPHEHFTVYDSDGFSYNPKQEELVMINPSGGWQDSPMSPIAPKRKIKLFLYFDYWPEEPFELMYRAQADMASMNMQAGVGQENLSFELDPSQDKIPSLPEEIRNELDS